MLASSYPFLDIFWTMCIFFLWVAWFMLLFRVIGDVFRRHDIGGGLKTVWLLFVLFLPFLGVFVYLIAQSKGMAERQMETVQASKQEFDSYVQSVAANGPAEEIDKAKKLLDGGTITQSEFDAIKVKALAA
jgi:hypothetical protein